MIKLFAIIEIYNKRHHPQLSRAKAYRKETRDAFSLIKNSTHTVNQFYR